MGSRGPLGGMGRPGVASRQCRRAVGRRGALPGACRGGSSGTCGLARLDAARRPARRAWHAHHSSRAGSPYHCP
eukprot:2816266-Alexandrium_andersonii.AAC.1